MTSARRRWWARLVLASTALLSTLLVLELGCRMYWGTHRNPLLVQDGVAGWRHARAMERALEDESGREVRVTLDARGGRKISAAGDGAANAPWVLFLGDSFTEGFQVDDEEVFAHRIARAHPQWVVENAGVGGYGTLQASLLLEEWLAARDEPAPETPRVGSENRLVLLVFFENDLSDNVLSYQPGIGSRPYLGRNEAGEIVILAPAPEDYARFIAPVPFRDWWMDHSRLFRLLNHRVYQRWWRDRLQRIVDADLARFSDSDLFEICFHAIGRIQAICAREPLHFGLVLAPRRESVQAGESEIRDALLQFARESSIPVLDLLPALRRAWRNGAVPYFEHDIHWTAAGHAVVAETLDRWIVQTFALDP